MKKKLIFLLVITILLLLPIRFNNRLTINNVKADNNIPPDLIEYCKDQAQKYVDTIPKPSDPDKYNDYNRLVNSEYESAYKTCITMNREGWETKNPPSNNNINNTIKKVCDDFANSLTLPSIVKDTAKDTCINYLKGTYNNSKCETVECFKKVLCSEAHIKDTEYCTGKKEDPKKEDPKKEDPGTGEDPGKNTDPGTGTGKGTGTPGGGFSKKEIDSPCAGTELIVYYAIYVIKVLHIVVPILLIIWASIDLVKSIMSKDEKKISEARKPVIQRLVSALLVFLLPWLVTLLVTGVTGKDEYTSDWTRCWRKAWNGGKKDDSLFNIRNW